MEVKFAIAKRYLLKQKIDSEKIMVLPGYDYSYLEWQTPNNIVKKVHKEDILLENDELIAFREQCNKLGYDNPEYYFVIIENNEEIFRWKLVQIDRDDNRFENLYLGKHKESIIHIHKHELHTSILSYKDEILKRFNFWGELINKKGDIISFERIYKKDKKKPVELIKLPELKKLESISYEESEIRKIKPRNNFPIEFLK